MTAHSEWVEKDPLVSSNDLLRFEPSGKVVGRDVYT